MKHVAYRLNGILSLTDLEEGGEITKDAEIIWCGDSIAHVPTWIIDEMDRVKLRDQEKIKKKEGLIAFGIREIPKVQCDSTRAALIALALHQGLGEDYAKDLLSEVWNGRPGQ